MSASAECAGTPPGDYPQGLEAKHLRPSGVAFRAWFPLLLLAAIVTFAMLGLFGGGPAPWTRVSAPAAELRIHAPRTLRSGVFFEMNVMVIARDDLTDATVAIRPELWRDMTINTTLPEPGEQEFRDGMIRFRYGPLKAGERIEAKFDGQVNPQLFGGTRGEVALLDGDRRLASVPLHIRVLP